MWSAECGMNSPGLIPHSEFRIGEGRAVVRVPSREHLRRSASRHVDASAWGGADAVLHAGRHPGHGARALAQRSAHRRRVAGARQYLPPARAPRGGRRRPARRAAPLHGMGPAAAHGFRRLPGIFAGGVADGQRRRRRVPESRGRVAPLPDAGARHGNPMGPRRRRRDGVRSRSAGRRDLATARDAMERTLQWLERGARRHRELSDGRTVGQSDGERLTVRPSNSPTVRQTMWPILQGGAHSELRIEGLRRILDQAEWTGLAVGGLSVGEPKAVMYEMLERLAPRLPPAVPRYLMGVGFPEDLVAAVARGVDLFDCVAPTRNGRNGTAYTADGPLNIRNAAHREDPRPLDSTCDCETCTTFSRGYLRHLFAAEELLGLRLLSLHNVRYLIRLAAEMRGAIQRGGDAFGNWAEDWRRRYQHTGVA